MLGVEGGAAHPVQEHHQARTRETLNKHKNEEAKRIIYPKKNPGENQKTNTNFIKEIREEEKISSKKKEPEKLHIYKHKYEDTKNKN